jgi:hypothetical protein
VQPASTTTAQRSRPRLALQHRRMREANNIAHLEHNNSCTAGETDMTGEGHKTSRTAALHTCSIIGAGATASSLAVPSRCILTNCQAAQARQQVLETKQPHPACHCELLAVALLDCSSQPLVWCVSWTLHSLIDHVGACNASAKRCQQLSSSSFATATLSLGCGLVPVVVCDR